MISRKVIAPMTVSGTGEVFVLGRFPPPFDGQTLATQSCADALEADFRVRRLDTELSGAKPLHANPRFSLRRTAKYVQLAGDLRRSFATEPLAPVFWHSVSPAPLGHARDLLTTLPALRPGQPVAAVFHRALFERLFELPVTSSTARRLIRRVQFAVFQSATLAARTSAGIPRDKVRIIPNSVSKEVLFSEAEAETRRKHFDPSRPVKLLFISNMLPEKGYQDILDAADILRSRGTHFELTLAGRWPSEARRRAASTFIRERGIPADILGGVEPARVRDLHESADVFLLPTYHPTETQPIAIIEALGAGTPVISTDRDVIRDMILDGSEGALVPPRDGLAIADAISGIWRADVWPRASAAARGRFNAQFSPHVVGGLWRELAHQMAAPSQVSSDMKRA